MTLNLSPKDLAQVVGVSESSLKRWVDEGRLKATRTAGGHRRIALHEAVRFIRDTNQPIVRPDMLGLADVTSRQLSALSDGLAEASLLKALESGQADHARGLIVAQFLASRNLAGVFDGPIANAMHRIGELWQHSNDGIMVEHRATTICVEAIHQVRAALPPVPDSAPVAVGSAGPGDPYQLPTLMASTVLNECGYRDVNLGPDLPIESLIHGVRQSKPTLVWMSVSNTRDRSELIEQLRKLAPVVQSQGAVLALGGRAVFGFEIPRLPATHLVASMSELAALARAVKSGAASQGAERNHAPIRASAHA